MNATALYHSTLITNQNGVAFRDLNKNGKLDIYEDPSQPITEQVENLLAQMTLEEKAGMLFINGAVINDDGSLEVRPGGTGLGGRVAITQKADSLSSCLRRWRLCASRSRTHPTIRRIRSIRLGLG